MTVDPLKLLTEREVETLRGLKQTFLKDDRRRKRLIPYVKLNKSVFYRLNDIDAALQTHLHGEVRK